jgi:hypothetical protein
MATRFIRYTSRVALALMLCTTLPLQTAQAAMVSTDQVANRSDPQRDRVISFLDRSDVRKVLEQQGVDPNEAKARVAAMTDDEVTRINGKLDQMPAGGDVIGVLFLVFVILLVTDILGLTKVFPFTRPIR